jgi:hypothetical protein
MAKDKQNQEAQVEQNADAATAAAPADQRSIMITNPWTGQTQKRSDFIRYCWTEQFMSRGAIAKKLTELQGKKVPYQTVFATLKKGAESYGGPTKAPGYVAPAATAPASA